MIFILFLASAAVIKLILKHDSVKEFKGKSPERAKTFVQQHAPPVANSPIGIDPSASVLSDLSNLSSALGEPAPAPAENQPTHNSGQAKMFEDALQATQTRTGA